MKSDWIAYVGHMLFPWGQAASRRVYGNAMSLVSAGYDVVVASGSDEPQNITRLECADVTGSLSHIGLGICPDQKESPLKKAAKLLFSSSLRLISWLEAQPTKPSHVILYGGYMPYMLRLLPWCRKNGVSLVADLVEWYEPSHSRGAYLSPSSINTYISMRHLFNKCDGIIAISSYLENYYLKQNCKVVRVPPTLDMVSLAPPEKYRKDKKGPLRLAYAGSPGKKDLLKNVIEGMAIADPEGDEIRLSVLGPSVDEVRGLCCGASPLPGSIEVMGKMPQDEVLKIIGTADFSVLLREPLRFANAGFPTKFVESMASGTPVIANITSDLGKYLYDGVEGIVCSGHSPEAFAESLRHAMELTSEALGQMRLAAFSKAKNSFDYRNYSNKLAAFIAEVRK